MRTLELAWNPEVLLHTLVSVKVWGHGGHMGRSRTHLNPLSQEP